MTVARRRAVSIPEGGTYYHDVELADENGEPRNIAGSEFELRIGRPGPGTPYVVATGEAIDTATIRFEVDCTELRGRSALEGQVWELPVDDANGWPLFVFSIAIAREVRSA